MSGYEHFELKFDAQSIGELVKLISDGVISGKIAKELLLEFIKTGGSPARWVEERGQLRSQIRRQLNRYRWSSFWHEGNVATEAGKRIIWDFLLVR